MIYMNDQSRKDFMKYDEGQFGLGSSLIGCHPEPARTKLLEMLKQPSVNVYTTEKNGKHKLIRQAPWYKDGVFSGVIEISFEIPSSLPHHIRS